MEKQLENSKIDVGGNIAAEQKEHRPLTDLMDDFFNKMQRNKFYKKELFLINLMAVSSILLLFYQNDWANKITFVSIFLVLGVVSLKLFQIFNERIKTYSGFVAELEKDKEESQWASSKIEEATLKIFSSMNFESSGDYLRVYKYISNLTQQGHFKKAQDLLKRLQESSNLELFDVDFEDVTLDSDKESPSISSTLSDSSYGTPIGELLKDRKKEREEKFMDFEKTFQNKLAIIVEEYVSISNVRTLDLRENVDGTERKFIIFLDSTLKSYLNVTKTEKNPPALFSYLEKAINEREFENLDTLHQYIYACLVESVSRSEKITYK